MNQVSVAISNVNAWPLDKNDEDLPSVKEKRSAILWHLWHVLYKYSRVHGLFFPHEGPSLWIQYMSYGQMFVSCWGHQIQGKSSLKNQIMAEEGGGGEMFGSVFVLWEAQLWGPHMLSVVSSRWTLHFMEMNLNKVTASLCGNELEQGSSISNVWDLQLYD